MSKYIFYIYCLWVWILSLAYYNNIIIYSLLYSSFFALLFTLSNPIVTINNFNILNKIIIIIIEILILGINIKKHFYIDKKSLFSMRDIFFNIILFSLYLLFLDSLGTSFYDLYFNKLGKFH